MYTLVALYSSIEEGSFKARYNENRCRFRRMPSYPNIQQRDLNEKCLRETERYNHTIYTVARLILKSCLRLGVFVFFLVTAARFEGAYRPRSCGGERLCPRNAIPCQHKGEPEMYAPFVFALLIKRMGSCSMPR